MRSSTRTLAATAAAVLAVIAMSAPASAATKSYTLAQVKSHKSAGNCWTAIKGNVYNITGWINRHPGGAGPIKAMCGRDGSAAFAARHAGQGGPSSMLATLKVGKLKK